MSATFGKILLATDGNEDSTRAALAAADLSMLTGARLHVVHVWTGAPPPAYPGRALDDYSRLAAEEAGEILRRHAWYARVDGAEVAGEHLRAGKPAEEITALAEELDADLVVLGSRGAGWLKRLVTGSVSEGVVRGAPCPVLVVRATAAWPPTRHRRRRRRLGAREEGRRARGGTGPPLRGPNPPGAGLRESRPNRWEAGEPGSGASSTRTSRGIGGNWTRGRGTWRRSGVAAPIPE